jgi:argininosuccinate lyase
MMATFPHPAYARRVLAPNFEQTKTYLVPAMLSATCAHIVMLVRQNILARATGRLLLNGLESLERESVRDVIYDGKYEDLFFYLEQRLGELTSEEAVGNMQIARSRNDLDGTMCRWVVREHARQRFRECERFGRRGRDLGFSGKLTEAQATACKDGKQY